MSLKCYSGSPILSELGFIMSRNLDNYLNNNNIIQHNSHISNKLIHCYEDVIKWVPKINYKEYWLDDGSVGVMLHPYALKLIYLNSEAIQFCRYIDGNKPLRTVVNKYITNNHRTKITTTDHMGEIEEYISFILLLEDLDLLTIKGLIMQ